jgi:hypothetical protein
LIQQVSSYVASKNICFKKFIYKVKNTPTREKTISKNLTSNDEAPLSSILFAPVETAVAGGGIESIVLLSIQ